MATVRELITKFGFEVNDKPLQNLENSVDNLKSSLIKVGAVAVAAGATILSIAKSTASFGDDVAKTARQIGVNTKVLQELRFAAQLGGASTQELDAGIRKFSRTVLEARRGNKLYMESLNSAGISTTDVNNKTLTADKLMAKISDKFKDMPDGIDKTALAMDLFGRAGTKLIPMLSQGSEELKKQQIEANKLGIVMGKSALKDAEVFTDELLRFQSILTGLKNNIGAKLIPIFIKLSEQFKKFFFANRKLITQKLNMFIKSLVGFMVSFFNIVKNTFTVLNALVGLFGGWEFAIKGVLFAMTAMLAINLLSFLGNAAVMVFQLAGAFNLLKLQALGASVVAALPAILIGAGIAGLLLMFDDLVAFFNGDNSVFGLIANSFNNMFASLNESFSKFGDAAKIAVAVVLFPIRILLASLRTVGAVLGSIAGGGGISGVFDALKGGVKDIVMPNFSDIGSLAGLGATTASTATTASQSNKQSVNQSSNSVKIDAPINISVPNGTNTKEVTKIVQESLGDHLSDLFTQTRRTISSPIVE